jgi:hypothetical protein
MNYARKLRTMRDATTSLVGSAFRRVHRDGQTYDARRIPTLGQRMNSRRVSRPNP